MCGIFCVISEKEIDSVRVISGLKSLQHRGRDGFGVSYLNNEKIKEEKHVGLIKDLETTAKSACWVAHTRYSTSNKDVKFFQPILSKNSKFGEYSISHNGNIPKSVWNRLSEKYKTFKVEEDISDTYKLYFFIEFLSEFFDFLTILKKIIDEIEGAFSLVIQTPESLFLLRDRYGVKPLEILREENSIIVSSESFLGVYDGYLPIVEPGSVNCINYKNQGVSLLYRRKSPKLGYCSFEYIYFLKGINEVNRVNVKSFREKISEKLKIQCESKFKNYKKDDILVSGVPSSGNIYGKSFSKEFNFTYSQFLNKRSDYPHRTFILGSNNERLDACKKKYIVTENIENKVIVLADDSIVRGNTMKYLVQYLKSFKPKEIHLIVGSPPIKNPCFYGVDFPDIEELAINRMSEEELRVDLGLQTLTYLDVENLKELSPNSCTACFTGDYLF